MLLTLCSALLIDVQNRTKSVQATTQNIDYELMIMKENAQVKKLGND